MAPCVAPVHVELSPRVDKDLIDAIRKDALEVGSKERVGAAPIRRMA